MKKFFKVVGIMTAIYLVLGIVVTSSFVAAGASLSVGDNLQNHIINRLSSSWNWNFDSEISLGNFDISHEIMEGDWSNRSVAKKEDIQNIQIEVGGGTCDVVLSDTDYVQVVSKDFQRTQCYVEGDTLYIRTVYRALHRSNLVNGGEITIYLPSEMVLDDLIVSFGAGEMNWEDTQLTAERMMLSLGAGEFIWEEGLQADVLDISMGAGNAEFGSAQVKEMAVSLGAGSLLFAGVIEEEMDAECGMGSLELILDQKEEDFSYDVTCAMGSVIIGGNDYAGLALERYDTNVGNGRMNIECAMASVVVEFTK